MKKYEVLEKALALIEDEKNWGQGLIESVDGRVCINGALVKALYGVEKCADAPTEDCYIGGKFGLDDLALSKGDTTFRNLSGMPTARFNDAHAHAEVLDFLREAIRNEKAKAGVSVEVPTETGELVAE